MIMLCLLLGSKDLGLKVQSPILFMLANENKKKKKEQALDIAQGDSSQISTTFKLQEKELNFNEARSIKGQA